MTRNLHTSTVIAAVLVLAAAILAAALVAGEIAPPPSPLRRSAAGADAIDAATVERLAMARASGRASSPSFGIGGDSSSSSSGSWVEISVHAAIGMFGAVAVMHVIWYVAASHLGSLPDNYHDGTHAITKGGYITEAGAAKVLNHYRTAAHFDLTIFYFIVMVLVCIILSALAYVRIVRDPLPLAAGVFSVAVPFLLWSWRATASRSHALRLLALNCRRLSTHGAGAPPAEGQPATYFSQHRHDLQWLKRYTATMRLLWAHSQLSRFTMPLYFAAVPSTDAVFATTEAR